MGNDPHAGLSGGRKHHGAEPARGSEYPRKGDPPLAGYDSLRREVVCNASTRLDLMLEAKDGRCCFIEVKNCTLVEDGYAYFPDAVTTRGRKHLVELQEQVRRGNRGVIFFLVQRTDAKIFRPADHIDPAYGMELRQAVTNGVEILVYDVRISLQRIALNRALPFELTGFSI